MGTSVGRAFSTLVGRALNKSLKFDTGQVKKLKDVIIDDTVVICYGMCANIKCY